MTIGDKAIEGVKHVTNDQAEIKISAKKYLGQDHYQISIWIEKDGVLVAHHVFYVKQIPKFQIIEEKVEGDA